MIRTFIEAQLFLFQHIPRAQGRRFAREKGITRTRALLAALGNPQNDMKVIHIAGTSGKGSTAYLTSTLLHAHGFRTGLHVSPHLVDIRERCQINNRLITKNTFTRYLNEMLPAIRSAEAAGLGAATYWEILTCLAYYAFARERCEYAIIETGIGGLYDATNVVDRSDKIAVITKIGMDHKQLLGSTISEIAKQKAGIIKKGNAVITVRQAPFAQVVIESAARKARVLIQTVGAGKEWRHVRITPQGTIFDYTSEGLLYKDLRLGLIGPHQAENCSASLNTISALAQRDGFHLSERKIRKELATARFPGRFEVFRRKNTWIVIDGAHNPQKMKECVRTLRLVFPHTKIFDFLIAFKQGKEYKPMLRLIRPLSRTITAASFFSSNGNILPPAESPEQIVRALHGKDSRDISIVHDPVQALKHALQKTPRCLVITGSLYFIGLLYPALLAIAKPVAGLTRKNL